MPKTKLLPVFRTNFNTSFAVLITFLARNQEYIDAAAMTLRLACNDDLIFKDKEELEASSSSSKIAFKKSQLNEDERNILKMVEQDASESALMERIAINSRLQAVMRVNVKRVRPENAEKSATIIASLTSLISVFNEVKFDSEKLLTTSGEKVTFEEVRNSFMIIAESLEKDKILDASQWSLVEQIRIWVVEELSLAKTNIGKIFRKTGVNSFITTCGFFIQPLMEIYRNLLELKVDIDPQKNIKRIEVQANVRCLLILPVADPRMITYLNKISFYFEGMEQLTYLEKKEGFDFIQDGTEILLTLADEFNRDIEKPETTFAKKEAMLQLISRAMIEVYQKRLLQGKKVVKSVAGIKYLEFKLEPKDSVLEVKINGLKAIAAISQIVHKDKIVNENESLGEEYRRARSLMKNHQLEALSFSQTDHSLKKFYDLFCKYRKDHIKDFQSDVQLKTIVLNLFSETIHLAQLCEEKAKLSKDMKYKATNFKNAYNLYINSASMMQILFATKQLNVGVLQKPQYDTLSVFMLRYNEATGNEVENDGGIYGIFDALLSNIGKLQTQYPDLQNRKPSVEEVEMANQNTKLLEKEEQRLEEERKAEAEELKKLATKEKHRQKKKKSKHQKKSTKIEIAKQEEVDPDELCLQYLLTGNIHEAAAVERSQKSQIANKILEIGNLAMNLVDHNYVKEHPDTKRKLSTCTQSLLGCDLGAIKISGIIYKYVANQILYGTISLGSQNVVALAKTNLFRHQSAVNIYGAVNDELKKHEFSNADNFKDICLLRARYNIEITTFNYLMGTSSLQDAINLKVNFNKSKNDQKPTSFDDKMLFVTRSLVAINESMTMVCQSINLNKKELQEAERSGEIEKMELSQEELNIATQCCKWHSTISKTIEHINYQHENRLDNAKIVRQKKIESIARKFSNAQEAKISWQQNKKPEDCSIEAKNMAKLKKSCEEWSKHRDVIDKLQQQFKNTFCSLKLEHQELLMNKADSQRFLSFDSPAPQRVISEALEYQDLPSSKSVKNPRIKELPLFLQNR